MVRDACRRPLTRCQVRSIFLSDIHLGCRHSQAAQLLHFLRQYQSDYLYLVGDIIDGRSLQRRWSWCSDFSNVLSEFFSRAAEGTIVRYAIGNHDEFLRVASDINDFLHTNHLEVAEEFVHVTEDQRQFLVVHGDRFDTVEQLSPWVSKVASVLYETLLTANSSWNHLFQTSPHRKFSLSSRIKKHCKTIVKYISDFEDKVLRHAKKFHCHGVICGHIHTPMKMNWNGLTYCNTGDWVENCTAFVEHNDGTLELVYFDDLVDEQHSAEASTKRLSTQNFPFRQSQSAAEQCLTMPVEAVNS